MRVSISKLLDGLYIWDARAQLGPIDLGDWRNDLARPGYADRPGASWLARWGLDWLDLAALGALAGSIWLTWSFLDALASSIWLPWALLDVDFAAHGQCFR